MKRPIVRATKWLGDIPVEGVCSQCPGITFKVRASSHRPNREEYQRSLQMQFEEHCRLAHAEGKPATEN